MVVEIYGLCTHTITISTTAGNEKQTIMEKSCRLSTYNFIHC